MMSDQEQELYMAMGISELESEITTLTTRLAEAEKERDEWEDRAMKCHANWKEAHSDLTAAMKVVEEEKFKHNWTRLICKAWGMELGRYVDAKKMSDLEQEARTEALAAYDKAKP